MPEKRHDGIEKFQFWNAVIPSLLKIYLIALAYANRNYIWLQLKQTITSDFFSETKEKKIKDDWVTQE